MDRDKRKINLSVGISAADAALAALQLRGSVPSVVNAAAPSPPPETPKAPAIRAEYHVTEDADNQAAFEEESP